MKRLAFLRPWLARGAAVLLLAGLLVRLSGVRDSFTSSGIVFYATPWPVLAALALGLSFYALGFGHRVRALGLALVFAGCAATWMQRSLLHAQPAPGQMALRAVYWNAARPTWRLAQRVAYLRAQGADFIAVGESNVESDQIPAAWREGFPGQTLTQRSGFLIITPEEPVTIERGRLAERGDYVLLRCMVKGRALTALLVDFESRPTHSRAPPFARLAELIAAHRDEPLVIMGDFNTPRESVHFDPWRRELREAFESAGRGFAETWPVPLPVLALDQMWLSPRWRAVQCQHGWSVQSDHRAIITDLALAD